MGHLLLGRSSSSEAHGFFLVNGQNNHVKVFSITCSELRNDCKSGGALLRLAQIECWMSKYEPKLGFVSSFLSSFAQLFMLQPRESLIVTYSPKVPKTACTVD